MWQSYLINLDKNKPRLENSCRQFEAENIPFERIAAINGWALDDSAITGVYDRKKGAYRYKYPLIKPEIGCYLSHIKAWQKIVVSGEKGGFVFEDDFEITSPLAPILNELSAREDNWDIVKLFSIKTNPKIVASQTLTPKHNLAIPYQVPTCLLGYGITAKAAKRLIKSSLPFFRPIDEDHKFFWEKDLRVALVTPSPIKVGDQQTETGTIGDERKNGSRTSIINRIISGIKSPFYQLDYKARLFYHRKFGNL